MSIRLRLFSVASKTLFKTGLKYIRDLDRLRKYCDFLTRFNALMPKGFSVKEQTFVHDGHTVNADILTPTGADPNKILLYIHGGGFVFGSSKTHRHLGADLASRLGIYAVLPNYALAPKHPFPAGINDVIACYSALLDQGIKPQNIVVGGDSAGGNLTFLLLAHLSQKKMAMPACAFTFAAHTDFSNTSNSLKTNAKSECVLATSRFDDLRAVYAPNSDPQSPDISPVFANLAGAPPILLQVSKGEILYDDSVKMYANLKEQGVDATLQEFPNGFHVFQMLRGLVPESDAAISDAIGFINPLLHPAKR